MFLFSKDASLHSQLSFCSAGSSFALCSLAVHYFAVYPLLGNLIGSLRNDEADGNDDATKQ